MREPLRITPTITIPAEELSFTASTSSGPGGQNVNKVASRVTLRWALASSGVLGPEVRQRLTRLFRRRIDREGNFLVHSQRYRDRERNLEDARARLRECVLVALEPPKERQPTHPPAAVKEHRLVEKRRQAARKEDRRPTPDPAEEG